MKTSVDLYPEEYYAYLLVRRRLMLWSRLFVAVVTALSVASLSLWWVVHRAESNLARLEAQVLGMELWGAELAPLVSELQSARERQRVLGQLVNEPAWSALLNELGSATGDNVWLREFSVETESQPNADGDPEIVHAIAILGYARSNSDFIDFITALSQSPHVTNVGQDYARKSNDFENDDILEFKLQAKVI